MQFEAPLLPAPTYGLYEVVTWAQDGTEPLRWLPSGVEIRPVNFGADNEFGVWGAPWDVSEADLTDDDVKTGDRPDISDLASFEAITVWGFDRNQVGDLRADARQDVRDRAARNLARLEPQQVETSFAARLLADAGSPATATGIGDAIAKLEAQLAKTQTVGLIHASAQWATPALAGLFIYREGKTFRTAMGHQIVFGGGYVDSLSTTLVATSPVFGWRGAVEQLEQTDPFTNRFIAIAERSVLVAYESAITAVTIS
ncbi:hypothetical protein AWB90_18270 [Mycobacterium paraense]|uniref:Gp13 protein n=1 Tax=Mycobacterium paraense TaxID=767916 RepID=A0A1X2A754_9MYCO|nr:hypothetical protein AWB90_18270 [Mycobacterium paraense]